MRLICAGITDVGVSRDHNEDNFYLSTTGEPICIVADGMGGHRSGEVASAMAVETIVKYYQESVLEDIDEMAFKRNFQWPWRRKRPDNVEERRLVQSLLNANKMIFDSASSNESYKGMGTTIIAAYFTDKGVHIAHIGDSRGYRLRGGSLSQLTDDHSLANEYVKMGIISKADIEHFPYKNVVTRACGLTDEVEVESNFESVEDKDIFLFCSDGLTDCVSDGKIEEIIQAARNLEEGCAALVNEANKNGGPDNITVVMAQTLLA